MSATSSVGTLVEKLCVLQRELEVLGFALDSRGSREAADVALATSARIGELRDDCGAANSGENDVRMEPACPLNLHETLS
jgi:hypothetical protein